MHDFSHLSNYGAKNSLCVTMIVVNMTDAAQVNCGAKRLREPVPPRNILCEGRGGIERMQQAVPGQVFRGEAAYHAHLVHMIARGVVGAGDEDRTRVASLEDWSSTIELLPH